MNSTNTSRTQDIVLWVLFVVLPLTYTLPFASYLLLGAIIVLLLFSIMNGNVINNVSHLKKGKENTGIINLSFYLLFLWFVLVALLIKPEFDCIVRIIQIIGCFLAFNLGANKKWNYRNVENIRKVVFVLLIISLCFWGVKGFPLSNYSFFFTNPNTFSTLLLTWLLFVLIGENNRIKIIFVLGIGVLLIYVSSSRASILSLGVYIIIYFILSHDHKKYGVFPKSIILKWELFFIFLVIFVMVFVFVYPKLMSTDLGYKIQLLSLQYSGKNFFSGRQVLWETLGELIKEKPFMGYGLGALPGDFITTTKSSHNIFMQIALQSGLIGLGLIVYILKRIYSNCLVHSSSTYALQALAVMFAMIIHENFEASLTQNLLIAGLQFWFMFGMGCTEFDISRSKQDYLMNL